MVRIGNYINLQIRYWYLTLSQSGHCVFKWILFGHLKPPPSLTIKIMFEVIYVKDIGSWASMVLQNYQSFTELTSNMIYIVAFGGGLKCPRKIRMVLH